MARRVRLTALKERRPNGNRSERRSGAGDRVGRGLGRAMAQRLAELGAAVAIHDINPDACRRVRLAETSTRWPGRLAESAESKTVSVCGTSPWTEVAAMVKADRGQARADHRAGQQRGRRHRGQGGRAQAEQRAGRADGGRAGDLRTDVIGTMIVCRAVCPGMARRGREGALVNTVSGAATSGWTTAWRTRWPRRGIVEWTQCLAVELAARPGVRRTPVCPGRRRRRGFW